MRGEEGRKDDSVSRSLLLLLLLLNDDCVIYKRDKESAPTF